MKKLVALVAIALAATASFGHLSVSWESCGFFNETGGQAIDGASQLLWQLVYTSGTETSISYSDGAVSHGANAEVLCSRLWTEGGTTFAVTDDVATTTVSTTDLNIGSDDEFGTYIDEMRDFTYLNADYTKDGGSIYSAIFRTALDGTVYYAETELVSGIDFGDDPKKTPMGVHFDLNESTTIETVLYKPTTVVPEPATMSLLGLGALAMVIRRKLRK